jgi:long-chain acyl-CoA synthetase
MLSHGAILCNCMGADDMLRQLPQFDVNGEIFLSFLPLSHSYEHTAGQFLPIAIAAQIYYAEGIDKLTANIAEARPTIMTAVPRLYEVMHARIRHGVERAGGFKKTLFDETIRLGRKAYEEPDSLTFFERIENALLDRLVRKKVHERFGGRLKAFVSGGAPLNYDIGLFFVALGLRILQGYGQTESAPVVSVNIPTRNKLHTVGPPLRGVEVKIAEDGEILVRGELVMQGYWNNPEATAETIRDGWLHTGDIGRFDADGFIEITDRKKDIIVNSGGDNLSPARVEGVLTTAPEIEQAMVYGDRRPHLVAVIVPNADFLKEWSRSNGKDADLRAVADDAGLEKALHDAVERTNANLSVIERVRRIVIAPEAFTIENEMMTPTMKLRRHVITDRYRDKLESLYGR